jgi:hypothetical protein
LLSDRDQLGWCRRQSRFFPTLAIVYLVDEGDRFLFHCQELHCQKYQQFFSSLIALLFGKLAQRSDAVQGKLGQLTHAEYDKQNWKNDEWFT